MKYALIKPGVVPWDGTGTDPALGVFLVQLLDDRTIKVEVVAGRTINEVESFSDAARIYRR